MKTFFDQDCRSEIIGRLRQLQPAHALFGKMRGTDWSAFCYKRCNHHLTQFGH